MAVADGRSASAVGRIQCGLRRPIAGLEWRTRADLGLTRNGPAGGSGGAVRSRGVKQGLLHALELVVGVGIVRVVGMPATWQVGVTRLLGAGLLALAARLFGLRARRLGSLLGR